ncbi:MAG: lysophospholipid acyltransferase family protein [Capsulimonadaceae bacterium]|nr:lysophospholipid acyltransferase family protein [Capsulimonadaceae bacterium]
MTTTDPSAPREKKPLSDRRPDQYTWLYKPVRTYFKIFFALFGGISAYGKENVPETGGAIIAANHASFSDPPVLATILKRPLRFFTKAELFDVPVFGAGCRLLGAFPVNRGSADRTAIRNALGVLENGELLVIFPEGNRGDGVSFGQPEKGIGLIALKAGVPIVPAYIDGTAKQLPKGRSIPRRAHLTVRFGQPIDPAAYAGKGGHERLAPDIMAVIEKLREEHRAATKR